VVMHEYGHALTARLFGIRTRDIVLFPLGGMARMERMSEKPFEEILITIAGPAVNVVLAILLGILVFSSGGMQMLGGTSKLPEFTDGRSVLEYLFLWNQAMVFFNLIPAFPMDGGRLLRAFLALFVDRISATRVAVYVAFAVAILFILAGPIVNPMLILAGLF